MMELIGAFTILAAAIYTVSIFIGFYLFEDFTGIIIGVAIATTILFVPRDIWIALLSEVIGN